MRTELRPAKPVVWIGSSLKDLQATPEAVKDTFGYALHLAQRGEKHPDALPLTGYHGAGVLEVVEDYQTDTYRAVYTVRFEEAIYVLHVFQKKSRKRSQTPQADLDLINRRLVEARRRHEHYLAERNRDTND